MDINQAIQQKLLEAVRQHQKGEITEAEAGYRWILGLEKKHPDALHLLGVIAQQRGQYALAIELIQQAIIANPSPPMYHSNLGSANKALGRLEEAAACYQVALSMKPNFPDALNNLGTVLQSMGRHQEALEYYKQALVVKPDYVEALYNLGTVLKEQGALEESAECFRNVLLMQPAMSQAHYHLAVLLTSFGRINEASMGFRKAITCNPDFMDAYVRYGALLQQQGHLQQAAQLYREQIARNPSCAEVYCNLGTVLKDLNCMEDAVDCFRQSLQLNPKLAAAHYNLGNVLQLVGKLGAAAECYRAALDIRPDWSDAHNNLGNVLQALGMLDAARRHFEQALSLAPGASETLNNLGNVYKHQAQLDAAIDCYRKALALKPGYLEAHSNLLFALCSHPSGTSLQYLDEAKKYGEKVCAMALPYSQWHSSRGQIVMPLRIGLVSGDFKEHPVGYFLEDVLAELNRSQFELVAYSNRLQEDELTERIKPYFTKWRSIAGVPDAVTASQVHDDGIHILVDLSGHTAHNRLSLFAWKAAPVQVSWLGYFASTGVPGVEYLMADSVSVPEIYRDQFTEKIWILPETRLCFSPPETPLSIAGLPALRNGVFTFGCCQGLSKLSDSVLSSWGKIMTRLPYAHLRLQNKQLICSAARTQLLARLESAGVDSDRVTLLGPVSREEYFYGYAEIDLALDTFPYPGGTTTCEALWMGVPTLTLAGDTLLSRQGASLLTAARLSEYVASSVNDYVNKAVEFSSDLVRLAALRERLRDQVRNTPVFDGKQFARHLENAFWGMWQDNRASLS